MADENILCAHDAIVAGGQTVPITDFTDIDLAVAA